MHFQADHIAWESPAGERLDELARRLPSTPRLEICVFGSAPLQLFIDPQSANDLEIAWAAASPELCIGALGESEHCVVDGCHAASRESEWAKQAHFDRSNSQHLLSLEAKVSASIALPSLLRQFGTVNADTISSDPPVEQPASVATATLKLVRTWIASCNDFRERERREIIEQAPSPQKLADYREELKWMIRGARALLNLVSDADFPARELGAEISGKLLQLEDSWQSLNNPMTDTEADAILHKAFQDEA
jgi:hypothetical protein